MRGVSSKNSDYLLLYHVDCIYNVSSRLLNVPKERFIEKTVGFLSKPIVFSGAGGGNRTRNLSLGS